MADLLNDFQRIGDEPNTTTATTQLGAELRQKAQDIRAGKQWLADRVNFGYELNDKDYGLMTSILSNTDADWNTEISKIEQSLMFSKRDDIPFSVAYSNIDALTQAELGKAPVYDKTRTKEIRDSFEIGQLTILRSEISNKLMKEEMAEETPKYRNFAYKKTADQDKIKEYKEQLAAIDEQMTLLQGKESKSMLTNVLKATAQSLPYTVDVLIKSAAVGMGAFALGGAVAAPGAFAGTGGLTGQSVAAGVASANTTNMAASAKLLGSALAGASSAAESSTLMALAQGAYGKAASVEAWKRTSDLSTGSVFYDLRQKGVEKDIAYGVASINGVIQGAIETALGVIPAMGRAAKVAMLGEAAGASLSAKVFAGLYARGWLGGLAAGVTNILTTAAGEGAEEFFQGIADNLAEYTALTISKETGYTFDKSAGDVLKEAMYEGVMGFASALLMGGVPAVMNTLHDVGYARNLKKDAENIPSKNFFINKHSQDEQFSGLGNAERKEALAQIYEKNHDVEGISNAEAKNLDADYMEINELSEQPDETEEEAVSSPAPKTPLKRRKDGRLHTQESMNVEHRADGKDIYTLKLGSAENRNRYGRIEYSIDNDTVRIEDVFMKPGQQELTGEFVTELMRRYPGYNVEWDAKTDTLQKVKDQLISENTINPDKLQRFLGKGDINERLKVREYIQGKVKEAGGTLTTPQAELYTQLLAKMAEGRKMTLSEAASKLQFKTFEEAGDLMTEEEKNSNKGAFQLLNAAGQGIIYVGKNSDISTLFHELVHYAVQTDFEGAERLATSLKNAAKTEQFRKYIDQHYRIMKNVTKKEGNVVKGLTTDEIIHAIETMDDNPMNWTATQHEVVAVLGETYAQEGRSFNKDIQSILDKFIDFFYKIYRLMKQNALLNDDIVKAYDNLFSPELKEKFEAQEQAETKTETKVNFQPTQQEMAEADRQYNEVVAKYKGTDQWLKAPNGQPTKLTERQWVQVRTPLFKAWFGDWENDPQNASKVVDENGEPRVVYHETQDDFDVFDPTRKTHSGSDYLVPEGVFTKTSSKSINFGGMQMGLFANIRNPLVFADREQLTNYLRENIENFDNKKASIDNIDTDYKARLDKENEIADKKYSEIWHKRNDNKITEEQFHNEIDQITRPAQDILDEWHNAYDVKSADLKADVTQFFKSGENDGIILEYDAGSFGRKTDAIIAFSPEQIKSATDNVGTFNQSNPSILFQTDTEYLDAVNTGDMAKAQAMVDARAREMGYNSPKLYHGTKAFGFTEIDVAKSDDATSFFATDRLETAETYSGEGTANKIGKRKQISEIKEKINQNADKMLDLLKKIAPKKFGRFTISDIANEIISNIEWENFNSIGVDPFFGLSKLYELFNMAVSDNENLSKLSVGDLDQTQEYKTYSKIFDDIAKVLTERSAGNYSLYAKTDKLLKIDAKGANWNKIRLPKSIQNRLKKYQVKNWEYYQEGGYEVQVKTRELSYFARQLGYRGVEIKNVVDNGGRGNKYNGYLQLPPATVYIFFDPQSQVKSADPVTYDDNGNVIPLSERFNPQHTHQNLLFQSAYHGSGASFDKFDTDFMGTGEGAQAFGWGIYLTQSEGIARGYAERYHKGKLYELTYNNEIYQPLEDIIYLNYFSKDELELASNGKNKPLQEKFNKYIKDLERFLADSVIKLSEIDKALDTLKEENLTYDNLVKKYEDDDSLLGEMIRERENRNDQQYSLFGIKFTNEDNLQFIRDSLEQRKERVQGDVKDFKDYIERARALDVDKIGAKRIANRNLYTASIPDDTGSNYLYWDKELTKEQIDNIKTLLKAVAENPDNATKKRLINAIDHALDPTFNEWDSFHVNLFRAGRMFGESMYKVLEDIFKSPKAASEFLSKAGFVGIDYPANSMSGGNKYGKRNFVIFNADDITIDNHLMWQGLNQDDIESDMMADAKGETLEDWLDFNRKMAFGEEIDEEYLTAIWEKANNVTETADGEKVVDTSTLTEEEKDNAFASIMQTEDGVKGFLKAARDMYTYMRNLEREGVSDEEDRDYLNRLYAASSEFETKADNFMVTFVKGNKSIDDIDPKFLKSLQGKILKNKTEYRGLFAAITDNDNMSVGEQELPFIDEPSREKMEHMTISEKRKFVDKLRDADAEKKILSGKETYEGAAENIIKRKNEEIAEQKKVIADKQKEIDREFDLLTSQQKKIVRQAEYQKEIQKKVNELSASIRAKLDKGVRIPTEEYQKLNSLEDRLKLIKEEVSQLNEQTKLKALVEKREALAKLKADIKEKEKERRAAQAIHDYKVKLVTYIQKKVGKNIWWEQAEAIKAIQAALDPTGYDNFFINYNGERMNLTAFRSMVDRSVSIDENGNVNLAELSPYQWKRYLNKDLSEYTIQDLEEMYDTVRYLKKVGREAWQQRVDQRNYEAQQWQNRIINEFMATGRYVSPSDVPLPETAEALKQEKNLWNMIRTGWYKTINMARKAQIMDGGTKAAIYKLLVSDKRDVQNAEYEAISKRIKPIEKLMKDLGVKPEDFYEKHTLKIKGLKENESTYTLAQLIYGIRSQFEERNKLAVMGGNLLTQHEKALYGHNNQTLEAIAESRYQQFVEQAKEILKGKEKVVKIADAIWNDWQNKNNFNRLNEAAIEEYNMPVDPVQFYMPIARKDFNGTELAQKIADDIFNQNAGKNRTSVEQGMLKSRQAISLDKQMPVDMDFFKLWTDSVKDQEHFIATNAYVRKLNRVFKAFGSKDLRANIESAFGRGMLTDIDNYINEVANPDVANDTQGVNKFLSILRGALYPAYLAFKSSSVILQMITSPAPFLREVGPLELAKGLIQMSIHPVATWEYVTGLSSFMENRSMNPLVDEVEAAAKRYNDPRWLQIKHKLQEVGTSGLEMADRWAVTAGWLAVFDKKKAEYLAEGTDEKAAEKKAVKYADDVVYETQPLGDKTELAPLFKVGGPAWQAFTQFQVSLNVIWNNLTYDVAVNDIRNKEYRKLAGTIIGYALAGVILYSVQEGWGTDDDDTPDEKLKKMLKAIAYGSTTQFTSAVPLLSNNADAIVKKIITGEKWSYRTNQLYPGFDELAMGVATTNWKKVLSGAAKLGGVPVSGPKEFYHVIHGKEAGDWRFYPQALLGRREKK